MAYDTPFGVSIDILTNWQQLAVLFAAGSVLISIMLIMFSRLFDLRELEQTAKKEFVFAASTVFIVVFVVLVLAFADTIIVSIGKKIYWDAISYCPDKTSEICQNIAKVKLADIKADTLIDLMQLFMEPPAKCTQKFLNFMYYISIPIEACASIFMEIYMSEHMSCFGLKWVAERITNTTQMMTFYMYAYYILVHTMNFVKYYAGYFFALGVVLRALPPARGAGAYLMAISVGLYFVFPFTYILVSTLSLSHYQSGFMSAKGVSNGAVEYFCSTPAIGDVDALQCGTGSIAKQFELQGWLKSRTGAIEDFFGSLHDILLNLVSVICVFPFIAFIVLMTFVLNTTNLFGGNIPEIGRGLVRLI